MSPIKFHVTFNTPEGHTLRASYDQPIDANAAAVTDQAIFAEFERMQDHMASYNKTASEAGVPIAPVNTGVQAQPSADVPDTDTSLPVPGQTDGFNYMTEGAPVEDGVQAPAAAAQTGPISAPISAPHVPPAALPAIEVPADMQDAPISPPTTLPDPNTQVGVTPAVGTGLPPAPAPMGAQPAAGMAHPRTPTGEQWEMATLAQAETLLTHPQGAAYLDQAVQQVVPGMPGLAAVPAQNRTAMLRQHVPEEHLVLLSQSLATAVQSLGLGG